jgi:hypothetical protein
MDDCQLLLQTKIPKRKQNKIPPLLESTATSEFWMLSKWPSEIVHARAARLSCRRFRQECMCMECASLRRRGHVPWSVIALALHNCKFSNSRTAQRPQLRSGKLLITTSLDKNNFHVAQNLGHPWRIPEKKFRQFGNFYAWKIFISSRKNLELKKNLDAPKRFVRIFFHDVLTLSGSSWNLYNAR